MKNGFFQTVQNQEFASLEETIRQIDIDVSEHPLYEAQSAENSTLPRITSGKLRTF